MNSAASVSRLRLASAGWSWPAGETHIVIDRNGGYSNCYGLYGVDKKDEPLVPTKDGHQTEPSQNALVEGINRFKTSNCQKFKAVKFQLGNDKHYELWFALV